jgi:AI-2 transport protein TqsA
MDGALGHRNSNESIMHHLEDSVKSISDRRIQSVCLMVLASVAIIYLVFWLRPVLVPFVVACFIVSGVGPVLTYLENRFSVSRLIAAGMAFLFGVALMSVFGLTIWVSLIDLSANARSYRKRVSELVAKVEQVVPIDLISSRTHVPTKQAGVDARGKQADQQELAVQKANTLDTDVDETGTDATASSAFEIPTGIDAGLTGAGVRTSGTSGTREYAAERAHEEKMREATRLIDTFVRDGIAVISQAFVSLVSTSVVVLIYVFFLLLGKPGYTHTGTGREIDTQIRGYLSLKTVISIFTGAVFGLTLRLFGVPMAVSFGVLAFLLNFIPNIGPIVASILPIPLILLDPSGNVVWMVAVIAATSTIQLVSGNVIEPKLMGNSSDLHPVTILLGLMFWGMMWGVIGMFLATPITAAIKIVLQRFEPTQQIANLMAGRWEGVAEDAGIGAELASAGK